MANKTKWIKGHTTGTEPLLIRNKRQCYIMYLIRKFLNAK